MPKTSYSAGGGPGRGPSVKPAKKVRRTKPTTPPKTSFSAGGGPSRGPSVSKKEARARTKRKPEPKVLGLEAPEKVLDYLKTREHQAKAKVRRNQRQAKAYESAHDSFLEDLTEKGVVGKFIDEDAAGKGREILFGSRNPSAGEVALAATPIPAVKVAKAVQTVLRGSRGLKTAERVKRTEQAVQAGRETRKTARKVAKAKAPTKKARVKTATRGQGKELKARLSKVERQGRRAKRQDRLVKMATSPAVAAAAASPGEIGERTRAFIKGTVKADKSEALGTTAEAIPGTFSFLSSLAGGGYRSIKEGDASYLQGPLKAGGEGLKALAPLFSGDAEAVQKATEEDVGYAFAPLLPRGAISVPARAAGRGVKATGRGIARVVPERTKAPARGTPGNLRRAKQIVGGRKIRKQVALDKARTVDPQRREGVRAAEEVAKRVRKAKDARSFRNLSGPETGSAAVVLARYGIGRKGNPLERLRDVVRSLDESDVNYVNTAQTVRWLEENPRALKDDHLWDAVAEFKKQTKPLETSPRAKYLAQGRIAGVRLPEERAPAKARELTGEQSREGAWNVYVAKSNEAIAARKKASEARARAREATGPRQAKLRAQADAHTLESRRLAEEARAIFTPLDPFTRPGTKPSVRTKRQDWDAEMVKDYVREVEAKRHPDLEEPAWLSERDPAFQPEGGVSGPSIPSIGARTVHIKKGDAERMDIAKRDLPSVLADSIIAPHVQRGINRFIRQVIDRTSEAVNVNGKSVRAVTAAQWNDLVAKGKTDPREYGVLPSRQFKQALEAEGFDLPEFQSELGSWVRRDLLNLQKTPGTKYTIHKREALVELSDQLNPQGHGLETFARGTGLVGSRAVLFSPAWLAAQVVNETSQVITSVGVSGAAGAVTEMARFARNDPVGYRALIHYSGDSAPSAQPVPPRMSMDAADHAFYSDAVRAARKTGVGRFLDDLWRFKTFANVDRWKSTRLQTATVVAHVNKEYGRLGSAHKELGDFMKGLAGMQRMEGAISAKLKGMSSQERLSYLARNPKELQRHLDYKDDVMGNWDSFTRFERQFGPLAAFYPYLRMSLRWTFWTYPKNHPVKAEMLYLFSQQNRDELEKILGREPTFLEGAIPVLYDEKGEPDTGLPGGRRFGAPGLNTIVETIGEGNITGVARTLNPIFGATLWGVTGLDPMSGEKVASEPAEIGLHALNQFLSLSPALRVAKVNDVGETPSPVGEVFENIDPQRALRSAVNPFIPLSGERMRMQGRLSAALEAVSDDPEYGDLVQAITSEDTAKVRELAEKVDLADEARKILDEFLPSSKSEEAAVSQAGSIKYEGTKALRPEKETASSSSSEGGWFGGGGGSGSTQSGGWFR